MKILIGNNLPSLTYKTTQCVGFFAETYKIKHNTDVAIPFGRSQKSQHKYIVSKGFLGRKLSPIINRRRGGRGMGGWNKNVLGEKKSKN